MARRLPSGYTEVEYIQSSGTQYINTGVVPTATMNFDVGYSYPTVGATGSGSALFGSRSPSGAFMLSNYKISTSAVINPSETINGYCRIGAANSTGTVALPQVADVMQTARCDSDGYVYLNDVKLNSTAVTRVTPPQLSLYLFKADVSGTSQPDPCIEGTKMYYFKLEDNGMLVRDLVPCIRQSDQAVGMYDLVTSTFYGNAGTGSFIAGPAVKTSQRYAVMRGGMPIASATGQSSQSGTPTPSNPVPVVSTTYYDDDGNPVELRKVGAYEDTYSNGVITRNVGVLAFDGTEEWKIGQAYADGTYRTFMSFIFPQNDNTILCSHFVQGVFNNRNDRTQGDKLYSNTTSIQLRSTKFDSNITAKTWLAQQYANGTPVTIYYPLASPTTETKTLRTAKQRYAIVRNRSRLPTGYREVEYIQSSGTQYIDLGNKSITNMGRFKIAFKPSAGISGVKFLTGLNPNGPSNDNIVVYINAMGLTVQNGGSTRQALTASSDVVNALEIVPGEYRLATTATEKKTYTPVSEFTQTGNLYVGWATNDANNRRFIGETHSFEHWDSSDTKDIDLVPCISPTNAVGMYDLVTDQFFPNAGSGDFTAGPEVKTKTRYHFIRD